jgi:predicted metal-binding membrane protein
MGGLSREETGLATPGSRLEQVLKRDRMLVLPALAGVVVIAAAYTVLGIGMDMSALDMTRMAIEMPGMAMEPAQWTSSYFLAMLLMWWMMMIAMMVPSATPAILVFSMIVHKRTDGNAPFLTACFVAGYLAVWGLFSLTATAAQWGLEKIGLVTGMMEIGRPVFAGAVLVAAGLYQLTPLKSACLRHCQQPVLFLMHRWKAGASGALAMGMRHGAYCLGCCWLLMALLFVGGVMNLLWIAGLAIYVAIEKLSGTRRIVPHAAAAILVMSGIWLMARGAV